MSYQVLARKWRPRNFTEVVGQQHVLQALTNALTHQRLHHAYLLTGTRGVGKTTIARILSRSLNCEIGITATPCGECSSCVDIEAGRFVDLMEIDAASRTKVEDTREILENVQYRPTIGRYKVYLIDEVHMLSRHSFNALLKTLEEPPPHVIFLLATTDPDKLPVTVLSRCLQFNLRGLTRDEISGQLEHILQAEQIPYDAAALSLLARSANGSMRDALSLTDQAIAQGNQAVREDVVAQMLGRIDAHNLLELVAAVHSGDVTKTLTMLRELAQRVPDVAGILAELQGLLHQLALVQVAPSLLDSELLAQREQLQALAAEIPAPALQVYYRLVIEGRRELPFAADTMSGVEMTLLRLVAFRPQVAGATTPGKPPRVEEKQVAEPATNYDAEATDKPAAPSVEESAVAEAEVVVPEVAESEVTESSEKAPSVAEFAVLEQSTAETVVEEQSTAEPAPAEPQTVATADTVPKQDVMTSSAQQASVHASPVAPGTAQPVSKEYEARQDSAAEFPFADDDEDDDLMALHAQQQELEQQAHSYQMQAQQSQAQQSQAHQPQEQQSQEQQATANHKPAGGARQEAQQAPEKASAAMPETPSGSTASGLASLIATRDALSRKNRREPTVVNPGQRTAAQAPETAGEQKKPETQATETAAEQEKPGTAELLVEPDSAVQSKSESVAQVQVLAEQTAAEPSPKPASELSPEPAPKPSPEPASGAATAITATHDQAAQAQAPQAQAQQMQTPQAPTEQAKSAAGDGEIRFAAQVDEWSALVDRLEVVGRTRQVLLNAYLQRSEQGLRLVVDESQRALLSGHMEASLRHELGKVLDANQLHIELGQPEKTPFQIQQDIDAQRLAAAKQRLDEHPAIQRLQSELAAQISDVRVLH